MVWLLMIILGLLTLMAYKTSKNEISNPTVLFVFPFFLMSIVGVINESKWELNNMLLITFFILIVGPSSFILGSCFQSRIKIHNKKSNLFEEPNINNTLSIYHLIISLGIEILAFLSYAFFLIRWGASHGVLGLSESINLAMMNAKFSLGETFNLPFSILSIVIGSRAFGYIYSTILAKNLIYKRKGYNLLLLLNVIIPICINLLGGSRGSALEPIVAFGVALIFYYYKKYNWKKKLKTKYVLLGICGMIFLIYAFFSIKGLLGRDTMNWENFYDDLYRYFGAQEKNLDYFLSQGVQHTKIFGYVTLTSFYNIFNTYLGFHIKESIHTLSFIIIKGYNFGNVYTCFYDYYIDFGLIGVIGFSFLSGMISQYVYKKAKYQSNKDIDVWLVFYVYIASCLVFSFFGNRFYTNLLGASFFRMIVWIFVVKYFLTKVKLGENRKG